jgi:hypothetical protein
MTWGLTAVAASTVVGAYSANKSAQTQADAAGRSADVQMQMFREGQAAQEPWRQAGVEALNKLVPLTDYKNFGMDQFQADPGYAFRLSEGQKALERTAASRGGLLSGGALKAATRYGQDYGSQEYTNAFNRYQTERSARLAPLQSLAGLGQTTAQQIGQQGMQTGSNVGNEITNAGAARASGYVGTANALTGGVGTYLNYSNNQNLVDAINKRTWNNNPIG